MKLAYWMYAGPAHIGTLRVASSFKNVHAIMHAPLGDDYFNVMRSMLERERDFTPVTASIVDRHVLARGSQEKVVDNITRKDKEERPDLIVLTPTCTSSILQEDLQNFVNRAAMESQSDVLLADVNHYRVNELQAADRTLEQIVRFYLEKEKSSMEKPQRTEKPSANIIGIFTLGFHNQHDCRELKRLLNDLGVEVNEVIPEGGSVHNLKNLTKAWFNIVPYREVGLMTAVYLEKEYGMPYVSRTPMGVVDTAAFIREIAKIIKTDCVLGLGAPSPEATFSAASLLGAPSPEANPSQPRSFAFSPTAKKRSMVAEQEGGGPTAPTAVGAPAPTPATQELAYGNVALGAPSPEATFRSPSEEAVGAVHRQRSEAAVGAGLGPLSEAVVGAASSPTASSPRLRSEAGAPKGTPNLSPLLREAKNCPNPRPSIESYIDQQTRFVSGAAWFSRSIDCQNLTGKKAVVFGDSTHAASMTKILAREMGIRVACAGTYCKHDADWFREQVMGFCDQVLITDDHTSVGDMIARVEPAAIFGTQMERHVGKRLDIPCGVISAPVHIQNFPLGYRPFLGYEGTNQIADLVYNSFTLGMEDHLLSIFGGHDTKEVITASLSTETDLQWSSEALVELKRIPGFVRGKVKRNTEKYARQNKIEFISVEVMFAAKEAVGA